AIVTMLLIAFVKGRLVILDFMELRNAPALWRALLEGWLILVSSLILLAYWISLK
ncbi:MAG: cytochrome C oxidase subunit IV family protein, partial [Dechloromonas sp.]|nr:cytochrome C oxidase subunit IV family protein [Dechloromonas sp.]